MKIKYSLVRYVDLKDIATKYGGNDNDAKKWARRAAKQLRKAVQVYKHDDMEFQGLDAIAAFDSLGRTIPINNFNPRRKKRYSVRKNSKRYGKRRVGSRRRKYGKRRR